MCVGLFLTQLLIPVEQSYIEVLLRFEVALN